jgi:DNA-binding transcriptional LysR family regulator
MSSIACINFLDTMVGMDTEQLLTFERILREGSFSRAALSLGLAQPTVSARIQALEQAVGGPLFTRAGRSVSLTDLGHSFLPYARRALDVLDAGVEAARQAQGGQRGRVSIGALESLSGSFLGPTLAGFYAAHPDVDVLVRAGRQAELIELLLDGVIGLALLAAPIVGALAADLDVLLTMREPVVLATAPSHVLARRSPVDQDTVIALARPFLVLRWWLALPPPLERLARRASPAVDLPMDTARQMVLSGIGAGFFPWMQVADFRATGQLSVVAITDLDPLERVSVLVRRTGGAPLGTAASELVAAIQARACTLGLLVSPLKGLLKA